MITLDFDKVETVFEHNITKAEIAGMFAYPDTTREDYIEALKYAFDNDEHIMNAINNKLSKLYYYRGDKKKAMEYADKITPMTNDFRL